MERNAGDEAEVVLRILEAGGEPDAGLLARVLRRPSCPGEIVERLAGCRWLTRSNRLLQLVVRHPRCPRHLALEVLPRLGWHDLVEVARDPRTSPLVRKQSERRLAERIVGLTLGERTALARVAPRGVIPLLLPSPEPMCIAALLDNPNFTESDALRLPGSNPNPACVLVLLRHPVWGRRPGVAVAIVRRGAVPLGIAIGTLPALPLAELRGVASSETAPPALRAAASALVGARERNDPQAGDPHAT
jgi:hypothetical protein